MNNKSKSKTNKNKRKKQNITDGALAESFGANRIPARKFNLVIPDKLFTKLTWNGTQNLSIAVGAGTTGYRYLPSAAYDVDPALGSTSMPGYAELASLYNSYRVNQSRLRVSFSSADARPCTALIVPLNTDPTSSPSSAFVRSASMNPYSKYRLVAPAGSPPLVLSTKMSTERIFGSKAVYFDDNFSSLVTTIPANNWYWFIGLIAPATVASSSLVITICVELELDVEFFCRKELLA